MACETRIRSLVIPIGALRLSSQRSPQAFQLIARQRRELTSTAARCATPSASRRNELAVDAGLEVDGFVPFDIERIPPGTVLQDVEQSRKSSRQEKGGSSHLDGQEAGIEPSISIREDLRYSVIPAEPLDLGSIVQKARSDLRAQDTSEPSRSTPRAAAPHTTSSQSLSARRRSSKSTLSTSQTKPATRARPPPKREPWAIQKSALDSKFPTGYSPRKKLSPDAQDGIRVLHKHDPTSFSTARLSQQFEVSPEAIRRILKSKWQPSPEEAEERRERWERRGERIWTSLSDKGVHAPKFWRARGIGKGKRWRPGIPLPSEGYGDRVSRGRDDKLRIDMDEEEGGRRWLSGLTGKTR